MRESEDIWRGRLATIFTGILRSNPDYLALSYEMKKGEGAEDVVRVERNPADPALVRVLPTSRLQEVKTDALMAAVDTLEPGDVRLSLESWKNKYCRTSTLFLKLQGGPFKAVA